MYVFPIIAFAVVIIIGAAWSPLFAVIIAIPLALIFLAMMLMRKRPREGAGRTTGEAADADAGGSPPGGRGGGSEARPRTGGAPASGEGGGTQVP